MRLKGGLGNQMFQYAAALRFSGDDLPLINTVYLRDRTPRRGFTYRNFDLDVFGIRGPRTFLSEVASSFPIPTLWLGLDYFLQKISGVKVIGDDYRMDTSLADLKNGPVFLDGFFQSYRFLEGNERRIREVFHFSKAPESEVEEFIKQIEAAPNPVSICVRGGDYLNSVNSKIFTSQGKEYYAQAIASVLEHHPDATFFVFDEGGRVKEVIPQDLAYTEVPSSAAGWKYTGFLRLQAACKHHIIANSTFHWWGAFLCAEAGINIAPSRWYFNDKKNEEALAILPSGWTRI